MMMRVSTLILVSSLAFALAPESAQGAPVAKKGTTKAPTKKAKPKAKAPIKAKAKAKAKPKAIGPSVSMSKGVVRVGIAPKDAKLDNLFEGAEIKSGSTGKIVKAAHAAKIILSNSAYLTPDKPNNGGMFLAAYRASWHAGSATWMEPEIRPEGDGNVSIRMPLTPALAGKDLKVECKGEFANSMSMRGAVLHNSGMYTTNSAEFSYITDTLKFMVEVPTTNTTNPAFRIAIGSTGNESFTLTSCSVEQI